MVNEHMRSNVDDLGILLPEDLDTPALIVDVQRLDVNISRMADKVKAAGMTLRPHAKTHKSLPIARRQLAAGASGLTVATMNEAEYFADGGCDDLFIAYPVWAGQGRAARLRELADRAALRVGVDGLDGAASLAAAVRGRSEPLDVMIEVDCGGHRTGVSPVGVRELAEGCLRLGLNVVGAFTHPGHSYTTLDGVAAAVRDEQLALQAVGEVLETVIDRPAVLSGGSTPTVSEGLAGPLTEARPGTYVFGDRQQMHLSGLPERDVALVVAARVVSSPRHGEAVLDSGSKALSGDRPGWLEGHGWLPQAPEARVESLSEEHAVVRGLHRQLSVGELVAVVPNHVCTAVNLGRELLVVDDGAIVDVWPIDGRRSTR